MEVWRLWYGIRKTCASPPYQVNKELRTLNMLVLARRQHGAASIIPGLHRRGLKLRRASAVSGARWRSAHSQATASGMEFCAQRRWRATGRGTCLPLLAAAPEVFGSTLGRGLKSMRHLGFSKTSPKPSISVQVAAIGWGCAVGYGICVPACMVGLMAKQQWSLAASRRIAHSSAEHGETTKLRMVPLQASSEDACQPPLTLDSEIPSKPSLKLP